MNNLMQKARERSSERRKTLAVAIIKHIVNDFVRLVGVYVIISFVLIKFVSIAEQGTTTPNFSWPTGLVENAALLMTEGYSSALTTLAVLIAIWRIQRTTRSSTAKNDLITLHSNAQQSNQSISSKSPPLLSPSPQHPSPSTSENLLGL